MPTDERDEFLKILRECESSARVRRERAIYWGLRPDATLSEIAAESETRVESSVFVYPASLSRNNPLC